MWHRTVLAVSGAGGLFSLTLLKVRGGRFSKGPWGLCSEPLPTSAFSSLSLTGRVTVARWCCCSRAAPVPMEGQGCRKGCDIPFSVPAPELEFGQKWNAGQTRSPPSDTGTAPTPLQPCGWTGALASSRGSWPTARWTGGAWEVATHPREVSRTGVISPVSSPSAAPPTALSQWLLRMGTGCSPGGFLLEALGTPARVRGLRPCAWGRASGCVPPQPPQTEHLECLAALGEVPRGSIAFDRF